MFRGAGRRTGEADRIGLLGVQSVNDALLYKVLRRASSISGHSRGHVLYNKVGHTVLVFRWLSYRLYNRELIWPQVNSGIASIACVFFSCQHFVFAVFNASISLIGSSSSNSVVCTSRIA